MGTQGRAPVCVHCGSTVVTRIALFGSQLMTSQYRCEQCRTYFEHIRWDDEDQGADADPGEPANKRAPKASGR